MTPPVSAHLGNLISVVYTAQNLSGSTAPANWTDSTYLSQDAVLSADDLLLGTVQHMTSVAGMTSYTGTLTGIIPLVNQGNYRVIVVTDSGLVVPDLGRANNTGVSSATMNLTIETNPLILG